MAASEHVELRVTAEAKSKITRAAAILHVPVGAFVGSAAEEKAEQVIRGHEAVSVVPADFFDDLLAALDKPAVPTPAMTEAMRRLNHLVARD